LSQRRGAREVGKNLFGFVDLGSAQTFWAMARLARKIENGGERGLVDSAGAAGQRHHPYAAVIEHLAEAGEIHFQEARERKLEQIDLALAQHAHQEAGFELA
jgi:hypothetical protein